MTTNTPTASTKELVETGIGEFATAEVALSEAVAALLRLPALFEAAYVNGDLKGGETIKLSSEAVSLAGDIAAVKICLIGLHEASTDLAKAAGQDIATPYAELPPRQTKSGDR